MNRYAHLTLDLRDIPRDLRSTRGRNDAIGTALIASATDRDERGNVIPLAGLGRIRVGETKRQLLPILAIIHRNLWRRAVFSKLNQRWDEREIMGSEDEVYASSLLEDLPSLLLRDASTHTNHHTRLGGLKFLHLPKQAIELLLWLLANATGVDQNEVRFFWSIDRPVILLKDLIKLPCVVLVHLTPVGADVHALLFSYHWGICF
jgi:hypothetical protein